MAKKLITIDIGSTDENADWLKKIDNGRFQEEDLQAHKDLESKRKLTKVLKSLIGLWK